MLEHKIDYNFKNFQIINNVIYFTFQKIIIELNIFVDESKIKRVIKKKNLFLF